MSASESTVLRLAQDKQMVRINQYGEIVRDEPPGPPAAPPPSRRSRGNDGQTAVAAAMLVSAITLGILGGIHGHGAGKRWCPTAVPEEGKWATTTRSFLHAVYLASWSSHPVHHAVQDASIPLRVLVMVVLGLFVVVSCFAGIDASSGDGEGCGTLFIAAGLALLSTALAGAIVRGAVYVLTLPVVWFVPEITSPLGGAVAVGACWAVIGALLGMPIGAIIAASE